MFADKPLPQPPVPPKPDKVSPSKLVFKFASTNDSRPPVPPHGGKSSSGNGRIGRDENENIAVTLSASDVKKGASTVSAAVAKFGPTIIRANQELRAAQEERNTSERRKPLPVVSAGQKPTVAPPLLPAKPPLKNRYLARENSTDKGKRSDVRPTVVIPSASAKNPSVLSARKLFEQKAAEWDSPPTIVKPLPPTPPSKPFRPAVIPQQAPTVVRPTYSAESKSPSVKALQGQLRDKLTFDKPTVVRPSTTNGQSSFYSRNRLLTYAELT